MHKFSILAFFLLLVGCMGEQRDRFLIDANSLEAKVPTDARTISVLKINLPTYATEAGILIQNETGAIVSLPKADWADDTERAMRLFLVRNLASITGAEVASDPWPLGGIPEAEIRIDIEQMLVDNSNTMRLSGQFSIRRDVIRTRSRIRQFNITSKARSSNPEDVVDAHSSAWQELARTIAKAI